MFMNFNMLLKNRQLIYWAAITVLFWIIAIVCISFIFAPVTEVTEYEDGEFMTEVSQPISIQGGMLLAESWKKYPNYIIGLGAAAGLAFAGSIVCLYRIDNIMREDHEETDISVNN